MVDVWENNTTRTWAEESSWSPKRDKTQFSVPEQDQDQEKALINGFQKNLVLNETENMWEESSNLVGNGESNGAKYEYPLRPYAEDCSFYLRTGCCKFGFYCKFNHPVRGGFEGVKEKEGGGFEEQQGQIPCKFYQRTGGCMRGEACRFNHTMEKSEIPTTKHNAFVLPIKLESKTEGLVEKTGKIECKYHLSAGGCKYGNACRYSHSKEVLQRYIKKSEKAPLELNFLGLPIRVLEKDCPFYMRNGYCAYGVNCWYHHPDPIAAGGSDHFNATPNEVFLAGHSSKKHDSLQFKEASEPALESWSSNMGSIFAPARTKAVNNISKTADTSTYLQQDEEFPERPGEPQCDYFMKTGKCKYRSACRFHHPKSRAPESSVST